MTDGQEAHMINAIARALEGLGLPVTPTSVEHGLATMRTLQAQPPGSRTWSPARAVQQHLAAGGTLAPDVPASVQAAHQQQRHEPAAATLTEEPDLTPAERFRAELTAFQRTGRRVITVAPPQPSPQTTGTSTATSSEIPDAWSGPLKLAGLKRKGAL